MARSPVDDGFVSAQKIDTKHFTVFLALDVNQDMLVQRIDIDLDEESLAEQTNTGAPFLGNSLPVLLDALFTRTCGILDMHLYSYRGIIKVVNSEKQMEDIYLKIFGMAGDSNKGFYIPVLNTLYIAAEHFTKEILGHELAHAIIASYFVVQVPKRMAEMMAGYVEFQLRKIPKLSKL